MDPLSKINPFANFSSVFKYLNSTQFSASQDPTSQDMAPSPKPKSGRARKPSSATAETGANSYVSTAGKFSALAVYIVLNMALIFFNKIALGKVPFPYLLTSLHAATAWSGCQLLFMCGLFTPNRLVQSSSSKLAAFSVLYTLNIALSNVSLQLVSIPFHQVIRATTPVWTVLIYRSVYGITYPFLTYVSLLPVIAGVGFATYGDYAANARGFTLTLLGAVLAAIKTIATNRFQTSGVTMSALELLNRMSPLAMLESLVCAYAAGEFREVIRWAAVEGNLSLRMALLMAVNGVLAFALNLASFSTNKTVGALTMNVAANLKQIISIVLSMGFFNFHIQGLQVFGVTLTSFGGALYSKAELMKKATPQDSAGLLEEGRGEKQ